MTITIYSLAYLASLSGLVLWFFFQENRQLSKLLSATFLIAFGIYAVSLGFAPGDIGVKLWVLFRDLMVLGVASQIFMWVKRSQWSFFALLLFTYGLYFVFYQDYMERSFSNISSALVIDSKDNSPLGEDSELLIELSSRKAVEAVNKYLSENGFKHALKLAFEMNPDETTSLDEYFVLDLVGEKLKNLDKTIEQISQIPGVSYVETNEKVFIEPSESTELSPNKLSYTNDPELRNQWSYLPMEIEQVHQLLSPIKPPSGPAKVAILDTGVEAGHEDLSGVYFSTNAASDKDIMGHGTHCAGIVAAISNNGIGVSSMDPNQSFIRITSIRVFNSFGGATQQAVIQGMIKAADSGVDVISMSLGGLSNDQRHKAYNDAVKYCSKKNVIIVVAAGNSNADAKNYCPANAKGVIAVGSIAPGLEKANYSNTVDGLEMGISAPGSNILSTYPKNEYKSLNGTSMACPQVAGLIGIMRAINPELTTKEAYKIIESTAKKDKDLEKVGYMIQPLNALKKVVD